ncbi:hypothetical protein J4Q44_G00291540 [Coregonus suidteri]|uniref:Uncharacterized protein n=1 Tax=Coregonus suidteri TaxID=861788 RepID=A0AAN8QJD3_9TELE
MMEGAEENIQYSSSLISSGYCAPEPQDNKRTSLTFNPNFWPTYEPPMRRQERRQGSNQGCRRPSIK